MHQGNLKFCELMTEIPAHLQIHVHSYVNSREQFPVIFLHRNLPLRAVIEPPAIHLSLMNSDLNFLVSIMRRLHYALREVIRNSIFQVSEQTF